MYPILTEFKQNLEKILFHLKEDLKIIRTGRANPALIDNLFVQTYGGQTKLKLMELATINIESPSVILVTPFDPSTIQDIEKAILKSPLGLSPQTQGTKIIIKLPALSQEQREKLIKFVSQKIEERKNSIRNQRDDARKKIKLMFEAKQITEDDKFRLEKEINNITQNYTTQIQEVKDKKEKEIMEV